MQVYTHALRRIVVALDQALHHKRMRDRKNHINKHDEHYCESTDNYVVCAIIYLGIEVAKGMVARNEAVQGPKLAEQRGSIHDLIDPTTILPEPIDDDTIVDARGQYCRRSAADPTARALEQPPRQFAPLLDHHHPPTIR